MVKSFLLDTNVLLYDANAIFNFDDNNIIIPISVIEELDNKKIRNDSVGKNARTVSRYLDELRKIGNLSEGVPLSNGGTLRIVINNCKLEECEDIDLKKVDMKIIALAKYLSEISEEKVIIVTKDINLRIIADSFKIYSEDYTNDKIDLNTLYLGYKEIEVGMEVIDDLYLTYKNANYDLPIYDPSLLIKKYNENEYVMAKSNFNNSSMLLKYKNKHLKRLTKDLEAWGIQPLNRNQQFAMDLLLDDNIKIVTLIGNAGSGKTIMSIACALRKTLDEEVYSKILIVRPIIPIGNDLGFMPGSFEEKIKPWIMPIYDNLEYIIYNNIKNKKKKNQEKIDASIDYLIESGKIEFDAVAYVRGRSISQSIIIIDDSQNLTPFEIKTIISRIGKDSKIILTGDPNQVDSKYLDKNTNGLTYLVNQIYHKNEKFTGHVTLEKIERSEVAEFGASLP